MVWTLASNVLGHLSIDTSIFMVYLTQSNLILVAETDRLGCDHTVKVTLYCPSPGL